MLLTYYIHTKVSLVKKARIWLVIVICYNKPFGCGLDRYCLLPCYQEYKMQNMKCYQTPLLERAVGNNYGDPLKLVLSANLLYNYFLV